MENKVETAVCEEQVSGKDPEGRYILSVIAKRTYQLTQNGECVLSDDQVPIVGNMVFYEDNPRLLSHDVDVYPFKLYTDVILKGKARNTQKSKTFLADLYIGKYGISIRVFGNRKTFLNQSGEIEFSSPELVEEVPLRYDFAFGGRDVLAEKKIKLPPPELTKYLPKEVDLLEGTLCRYKRNPFGKGFLSEMNKEAIGQLELPNLEDPNDLLQPENLIPEKPEEWYKLPLPRCTDWFSLSSFPRTAYFGMFNLVENPNLKIKEVLNGWAEKNILSIKPLNGEVDFRCTSGASLGLQLPYLKPGERMRLINMHPKFSDFVIQLPKEYPNIWVDGRKGTLKETKPVIHTVTIEPEENRLSIVWRGSAVALRPYMDEELKTMPYKVVWISK